ncbi:hypothetical protein CL632_00905 [bacterium]|jgi:magnesium transporter|nr:hypothetical protein [bacterium]MDP6571658.1 magnesium transporter CorA family protein [Patescibacteria group bacterium]|tara:strand:- start:165 stop:1085 length:921 start_codon:yes stop_codon:yes gene_type:complete
MPTQKTQLNKFVWHNITDNSEQEIRYLRDNFEFEPTHLTDTANPPLRPKIDFSDKYVFIVLLFPVHNRKTGIITISEIDIFANKDFIATVHKNEINVLQDLAQKMDNEPSKREKYQNQPAIQFLLDMLENLNLSMYPILNHVSWDIDNIDTQLFTGHERELVSKILAIKRNIVSIRKTMRAQKNVLQELHAQSKNYFNASKTDQQFNRIINLSTDLWIQLENHTATINAIQESNESLISFRLNDIMKTLTIFSVIVFPLTLLAAIFGMNTTQGMPFMGSFGFWKVMVIMGVGTMFMFGLFKKHKWI